METLHRLFVLDRLLQGHRHPVPTSLFLVKMECSLSTFKRLMRVLREQYHYPICYSREHKGYYYDRTQAIPVSGLWFSANELQALLLIRQLLQRLQPSLLEGYFNELAEHVNQLLAVTGETPSQLAQRIHVIPIAHPSIAADIFLPLCQATLNNQAVHIHYQDIQGHVSERTVSPQRLVYYRNHWYVDAWCHLRQALRTFWVAGIQSVEPRKQLALSVEEDVLALHLESSYGIFSGTASERAHLRFTGCAAMRTRGAEWHPLQRQQVNADGSVELWVPYSHPQELILDILRYGAEVEVLAPEALQTAVIQAFQKALAIYDKK